MNEKLAGITSEHTELRSVFLHEGRVVSYIFHVFTGQFYTIDSGTLLPKKNMVIAAKFSEGYFDALKAASPKRREDYEPLRERFGEADARRISDVVRHGDLYFSRSRSCRGKSRLKQHHAEAAISSSGWQVDLPDDQRWSAK
ncbi:hypothetical protein [Qipengyuania flava]|uniref:hypothetical protein n=1 Tax=Qipengyuania flava TaxID=192812 RepID=UPI00273D93BF|nr:hypothetical protein [Qipengyuania flava]